MKTNSFDEKAREWDLDANKIERANKVAQGIINTLNKNNINLNKINSLEIGCGTGLLSFALQNYFHSLTLADNSSGMLEVLQNKIKAAAVNNMFPLKLSDEKFSELVDKKYDVIMSLMTLHHIDDLENIFAVFNQHCKNQGFLVISDLYAEDGSFHGEGFSGHLGFNPDNLRELANRHGFANITFEKIFSIYKENSSGQKEYPLFLLFAQKI